MINKITFEQLSLPDYAIIKNCCKYFDWVMQNKFDDINCWVAGGAIRAYYSPDEKISDIDIFTTDRKECARLAVRLRGMGFRHTYINKNAIKGYIKKGNGKIFIDIVKRFYPSEDLCIMDFDFSVCKFAYNLKFKQFYHGINSFVDLIQKKLVIPNPDFGNPIGSLKRMQKYIKNGYSACNGTILTMAKAINKTDLTNPDQNDIEFYPDERERILFFD